jgi:RHS repeat-associated protein
VSYRDPDMGLWTYDYDANSNLISQTDTKGQTALMEYDAINRLVKKEYPDGSMVRFYYDEDGHGFAKGRLTRVVYPDGAESFNYDARGRQISVTQTIDGHSRTQSMTYDSMDRVVTTTYPDGEVVQSGYNRGGNLNNLSGDLTYVYGIDYTPYGKISKIQYGNGVQAVYNYYDQAGEYDNSAGTYHSYRLKQIQVSKDGGDIFNLGYEYDQAGNVKVKRDLNYSNFTEEYSYDDLNRLIGSGSPAYGYSLYRYDEINNIREKDLRTYQYSGSQPHAVTDDGRYIYTYDANGNMIGRSDGRVIEWDYENRIKSISDSGTFAYDPSGRRIKKSENGVTTYYFFATYEEEYQNGSKTKSVKFYFAGDQRVAEYSDVEGLRYYHQDHLGSSVALTDITGTLVFRANYAPYGSDAFTQGSTLIKYKFTGQEKDGSGLYYYGARYYDPELGRFISPDVNLDGLNRYTYCHNNPVIYNDPTGEWAWIVGAIIGAVTGHEVAESKGIDVGSSDWWEHVITGAVIGGVAGGVGEAVFDGYMAGGEIISRNMLPAAAEYFGGTAGQYLNALYQKEIAIALGLGGATSGFITGFGNSYAFGGEGTGLFRGDLGHSLENGLYSAFYGFAIGYGIGCLNPELFKETYDNIKIPLRDTAGQVHKMPLKSLYNFKYGKWLNVGRDSITKFIYSTSYQSCAILNL